MTSATSQKRVADEEVDVTQVKRQQLSSTVAENRSKKQRQAKIHHAPHPRYFIYHNGKRVKSFETQKSILDYLGVTVIPLEKYVAAGKISDIWRVERVDLDHVSFEATKVDEVIPLTGNQLKNIMMAQYSKQ